MLNMWYHYTFEDGYQTISRHLSYKKFSMLTHAHGKVVKKVRYKG